MRGFSPDIRELESVQVVSRRQHKAKQREVPLQAINLAFQEGDLFLEAFLPSIRAVESVQVVSKRQHKVAPWEDTEDERKTTKPLLN